MRRTVLASVLIALAAFALPPVLAHSSGEYVIEADIVALVLGAAWLAVFGYALVRFRWKSIPLLLAAPFALLWATVVIYLRLNPPPPIF